MIKKISESSADLIVSRFNKVYSDHVVEQRWLGDYEIGREYKFDELNRHTFTDAETEELLAGNKIFADDFVSKEGKIFSCELRWKNGRFTPKIEKRGKR